MRTAEQFLSARERADVEAAIAEAEGSTSGEIVPVVATCSGRYDRAEDIVGVLVAVVALTGVWWFLQGMRPAADWGGGAELVVGLGWILLTVVGGFVLGSAAATWMPALRLPFIPRREMSEEVERRVAESFYRFAVGRTQGGTGILIYVSLYERRVVVQGDRPIAERLGQEHWNEVRDLVLGGIRDGRLADGLKRGVLRCGELLSQHFPIQGGDRNELPNKLRLVQ